MAPLLPAASLLSDLPAFVDFDAKTYTGDVRLRLIVTRTFMVYVEDLYYFYDSLRSQPLMPALPSSLQRQGVRVGLTLRVPAL